MESSCKTGTHAVLAASWASCFSRAFTPGRGLGQESWDGMYSATHGSYSAFYLLIDSQLKYC